MSGPTGRPIKVARFPVSYMRGAPRRAAADRHRPRRTVRPGGGPAPPDQRPRDHVRLAQLTWNYSNTGHCRRAADRHATEHSADARVLALPVVPRSGRGVGSCPHRVRADDTLKNGGISRGGRNGHSGSSVDCEPHRSRPADTLPPECLPDRRAPPYPHPTRQEQARSTERVRCTCTFSRWPTAFHRSYEARTELEHAKNVHGRPQPTGGIARYLDHATNEQRLYRRTNPTTPVRTPALRRHDKVVAAAPPRPLTHDGTLAEQRIATRSWGQTTHRPAWPV